MQIVLEIWSRLAARWTIAVVTVCWYLLKLLGVNNKLKRYAKGIER